MIDGHFVGSHYEAIEMHLDAACDIPPKRQDFEGSIIGGVASDAVHRVTGHTARKSFQSSFG